MKTLTDHLGHYARFHRDARNIATHFVGIPMIVFAVQALLARPHLAASSYLSAALLATVGTIVFYLLLSPRLALVMASLLAPGLWAAHALAAQDRGTWLTLSLGLFVVGWIIQFVGHIFEGRKPAFVDDLVGLLVGPLFVVVEVGFALGLATDLRAAIEEQAGPVRGRRASLASRSAALE